MATKSKEVYRQKHPFGTGYYPDGALGLIIGTAPPYRFCTQPPVLEEGDVNYFYGSHDNYLWYILKYVLEPDEILWCRTHGHCRKFQKIYKLAFADMLLEFDRKGQGADDNSLTPVALNLDIYTRISSKNGNIRFVYFTSQAAFALFVSGLSQQSNEMIVTPSTNPALSSSHVIDIPSKGKRITAFVLISPSGGGALHPSYNAEIRINPKLDYQTFLYANYLLPFTALVKIV